MYLLELFFVMLLFQNLQCSSDISIWKNELNNPNCNQCLISRKYFCQKNEDCEITWYKENIYNPFLENCFGKDQLYSDDMDEFLRLLNINDPQWRISLQKLLDVVDALGLWSNSNFFTKTGCIPTSSATSNQNPKPHSLSAAGLSQQSSCSLASTTYFCPINRSMIWRERFRLCEDSNITSMFKCDCRDEPDLNVLVYSCALPTTNQNPDMREVCSCFENEFLENSNQSKNPSDFIGISQKPITITTLQYGNEGSSNDEWKAVAIILCICVMLLFASIIYYICWKICKSSESSKEDADIPHATDTSVGTNNPSVFSSRLQSLPDSRYFCIGDNNESLYHTIEPVSRNRGNNARSASVVPPPLPNRMFSLTSTSDESAPPRNWPPAPSPPLRPGTALTLGRYERRRYNRADDASEQAYEIPIPGGLQLAEFKRKYEVNEYESEISDEDDGVRVNPLYSTSEDEL